MVPGSYTVTLAKVSMPLAMVAEATATRTVRRDMSMVTDVSTTVGNDQFDFGLFPSGQEGNAVTSRNSKSSDYTLSAKSLEQTAAQLLHFVATVHCRVRVA